MIMARNEKRACAVTEIRPSTSLHPLVVGYPTRTGTLTNRGVPTTTLLPKWFRVVCYGLQRVAFVFCSRRRIGDNTAGRHFLGIGAPQIRGGAELKEAPNRVIKTGTRLLQLPKPQTTA
jgi:hypothetical protein